MMKKDVKGIEKIVCGRIDLYYPLEFEKKYNFNEICKKINDGIDKDFKRHQDVHQQELKNIQMDVQDNMSIEASGTISLKRRIKRHIRHKNKAKHRKISRENMNNKIFVNETENGMKIGLFLEELETYHSKHEQMIIMYKKYEEIYGRKFAGSQDIFVLFPLQVQLNNGEYTWLNAMLFVFQNGMGILKIEMNLLNVSSQPLMNYKYNEYIKTIENPWLIDMRFNQNTMEGIEKAYLDLIKSYGIKVKQMGNKFHNIIFSQFDGMPKQINNIPNKTLVDLYRIIAAPVTMIECMSYEKEAQEYIKEHQWGKFNSLYICSTTGGCLSITDMAFAEYFMKLNKHKEEGEFDEESEKKLAYEGIINNLCLNVEYAIIIMILKYITKENFYELQLMKPHEMYKIKKEYNFNVMFIAELQEHCFGTVSEQIECFEKIMPYYLNEKMANEKLNAINAVFADEESNRYLTLQNLISFGGLMMTAIFGLPAIYETSRLIREICVFIKKNIPIITVENFSLMSWLFLTSILIISVCCKWSKSKGIRSWRE